MHFIPSDLDFIQLFCLDNRVGFSYRIPCSSAIIKRAVMFVWVAVCCTEKVTASTIESCQTNSFLAGAAPVWTLLWLGLTTPLRAKRKGWLHRNDLWLLCINLHIHSGCNSRFLSIVAWRSINNAVYGWCSKFSLLLFQHHIFVALGTHVHSCRASKEPTIVDAQNGTLWMSLASSLIMIHFTNSPASESLEIP